MMKDEHISGSESIERAKILKQLDDLYLRWDDSHAMLSMMHEENGFGGESLNLNDLRPHRKKLEITRAGNVPLVVEGGMADAVSNNVQRVIDAKRVEINREKRAVAQRKRQAQKALAQKWKQQVRAQQAAVGKAMGLCNGMNARKETALMKSGAKRYWSQGFAANAKIQQALGQIASVAIGGSPADIERAGQKALALCQQALAAFQQGDQIQRS